MTSVNVKIYGEEYSIRSKDDPNYVHRVAGYVDEKMREVAATTNIVSSAKIAILAALNIADEYMRLKEETALETETVNRVLSELIKLIEGELET
jgi:cell division protein ZapA